MELDNFKCAVVLDAELPIGVAANIAAIMGVSLSKRLPEIVGANVYDTEGSRHAKITYLGLPLVRKKKAVNKIVSSLPFLR